MKKFIAIIATLCLVGCVNACSPGEGIDPLTISKGQRIEPLPDKYGKWWYELKQCSKINSAIDDLNRVYFYTVEFIPIGSYVDAPAGSIQTGKATRVYYKGQWHGVIELIPEVLDMEKHVKHEMMHVLLGPESGHPPKYFNGDCGNLIGL